MVLNQIVRDMNERGYNIYASIGENGQKFRNACEAIAKGLVLPFEEYLRRREGGQLSGFIPIDYKTVDDTLFMLGPQISEPNSPEKVFEKIKELETSGLVPEEFLGRFCFGLGLERVITPNSFLRLPKN